MKVQNLFKTLSPFAGISFDNELFDRSGLNEYIDNELAISSKIVGYPYREIIRNVTNGFFSCGGPY